MQIPSLGRNRAIEFDVTPLIDVVFLLIIFFLVSSHLARQEKRIALDLPSASSNVVAPETKRPPIAISLLPDGRLLWGAEPTTLPTIGRRLALAKRGKNYEQAVSIRADRAARFGRIEPLLLTCAEAGVWDVSFAVVDEAPP